MRTKFEEYLIQLLSQHALNRNDDDKIAERMFFDLYWKEGLRTPQQLSAGFRALMERLEKRDEGFTVTTSKGDARVSCELAAALAEFATRENEAVTHSPSEPVAEPPRAAEFGLSLLLRSDKGDALIGDLNERFRN